MACRGCLHAFGTEQILHANRHARHFAKWLASGPVGIDGLRRLDSFFRRFDDEGVERFCVRDVCIESRGDFHSRKCAVGYPLTDSSNA